jgi:hypothetical protein
VRSAARVNTRESDFMVSSSEPVAFGNYHA